VSNIEIPFEENPTRSALWLRGFFMGPTGGGKSKGSLRLASALFEGELPITLINSERGRGRLYADRFPIAAYIALDELAASGRGDFSPQVWEKAFDVAEQRNPGGIIVADSITHEWAGKNGVLQQADRFGNWKDVRPLHADHFVQRMLALECHLIVCCRAKMKYEVEEQPRDNGSGTRQVITPLGVGPIQDADLQYEFNLVAQFEQRTHECMFTGHVDPLIDTVHDLDDDGDLADVVKKLERWLSEGDPILPPPTADEGDVAKLRAALDAGGVTSAAIDDFLDKGRRQNRGQLHPEWVATKTAEAEAKLAERRGAPEPAPTT
jgi:hypothetical protein